ncbi:MAG: cohesin domain-containing protein [Patescibacteria group bacterium]
MNNLKRIILLLLFFVLLPLITVVNAASLKFDKTTVSTTNGGTFQIAVTVDPGSDPILSTDVYVTFDSSLLKANSVSAGSLFPAVTNDTATSGKVYITGMVTDTATPVTTTGTVATITFQALKDGSGTLSFDCNTSTIVKNDINTSNVINCSQNNSSVVTIGSGGGGTNPTSVPVSELPQSGVFDNIVKLVIPGIILLLLGSIFRLVL